MEKGTPAIKPLLDPAEPSTMAWLQRVAKSIVYKGVSYHDVVSDVLLKTKCEPQSEAYYVRLLTTTAIDHWRYERHRMHMPLEAAMMLPNPMSKGEEAAVHDRVFLGQIRTLISKEEAHIFGRISEGVTARELSQEEDVSTPALKTRIYRTRARVGRALGEGLARRVR